MCCMRASGFRERDSRVEQNWIEWASSEADRRTKFLGFCFLNIHTITYGQTPSLLAREIQLRLPCTDKEWQAADEFEWTSSRKVSLSDQNGFLDVLESLVTGKSSQSDVTPCAFGNQILLHGLLQRIYLVRQLSFSAHLDDHEVEKIQYVE